MFSPNKLLDDYFAKHPSSDRNSYDEEVFHSFIIDYATKNHLDLEMIYSKFDEDTFYQEENKTDELVCKEVAKYYDKSIYLKLIYELTKEPLSINEQLNIVDSFNLELSEKLLSKDSIYSENYKFKFFDTIRFLYGLHYERTRYERISKLLYVDFLKDQNLEMLSDFVYAFRKRDYETCYEILKDPAIFNDILYSNILNFYLALAQHDYKLCDQSVLNIDFRNPYIANYLKFNFSSISPFEKFSGDFISSYVKMNREDQQYLEYFAFLSIFRIISYNNEMVEDYSLSSYRENYAKLNLNNAEESFIVYMIIRTQILGNYSNNTDYKVIFNDIGKPKGKKRKKGSLKEEEQVFYTFLDTLVDKCYFDKSTRMENNEVLEVLELNDYSLILFKSMMTSSKIVDLMTGKLFGVNK